MLGGRTPHGRIGKTALVATLILTSFIAMRGSPARAGSDFSFPRPAALEPNIDFWVNAFTAYSERDFVIHDRDHVWRVYQVLHMPGEGAPTREEAGWANDYLKYKYTAILNHLATGSQPATYEEQRVAALFKGEPPAAYELAAQNLRVQQGLKEPFEASLLRSRYYRSTMERIFQGFGLPPELASLPSVESGFENTAHSSAGAVGIWQFTRATGKQYMTITRYRDDRLDPVASTRAAAQLLQENYEALGSWPLAITAYDFGTGGMQEAESAYGTDFTRIVNNFAAPHFGFAAKNYYTEFLAARQVDQYQDKYFPGIRYEEAMPPTQPSTILRVAARHSSHSRHHIRLRRASFHTHRHHRSVIRHRSRT